MTGAGGCVMRSTVPYCGPGVVAFRLGFALARFGVIVRPSRGASFAVLREVARSGLARLRLACCLDVKETDMRMIAERQPIASDAGAAFPGPAGIGHWAGLGWAAFHLPSGQASPATRTFAAHRQPHAVQTPSACLSHAMHSAYRAAMVASSDRSMPSAAFVNPIAPCAMRLMTLCGSSIG